MSQTVLSHAVGPTDVPLLERTIGDDLHATARPHPDREALVVPHQDVRRTYAELDRRVDELARALVASGFERGDRIGIWAPNCSEWVLVQYATARIGVILVNINPAYRTHEVRYALQQSGCRGLVAATDFKRPTTWRWSTRSGPTSPSSNRSSISAPTRGPTCWRWPPTCRSNGCVTIEAQLDPADPINVQYTSGTTGFPKGATLSHRNILNNGYFVAEGCRYTHEDRVCIPVPFYHCFGMVMGNLGCIDARRHDGGAGARVRSGGDAGDDRRTSGARACTACRRCSSPCSATRRSTSYDLSSLRTGIMAGSPCPIEVMKQCIERMNMDEVTICYGMTETSPVSTQIGHRRPGRQANRHGRPGAPTRRDQDRRPRHRRHRRTRRDG